ncbi:MAG: hypothetical protein R2731_07910 [Nocardioides sp.]
MSALAEAIRTRAVVRLRSRDADARRVHPVGLVRRDGGWLLIDALDPEVPVPEADWGTLNISRRTFDG